MEDEREKFEFKANRANLELALRALWREGKIDDLTYWRFLGRIWGARKNEELLKLARELARIVKEGKDEEEGSPQDPV